MIPKGRAAKPASSDATPVPWPLVAPVSRAGIDRLVRWTAGQQRLVEVRKALRREAMAVRVPELRPSPPPRAGEALGSELLVRERGRPTDLFSDPNQIERLSLSVELGREREDMSPSPDGWTNIGALESHLLVQLSPDCCLMRFPVLDSASGRCPERSIGKAEANEQQSSLFICHDRSHGLAQARSHFPMVRTAIGRRGPNRQEPSFFSPRSPRSIDRPGIPELLQGSL
jgi:hypothetical protein